MKVQAIILVTGIFLFGTSFVLLTGTISNAQTKTKCDYTYLSDSGQPEIGEDGEIKYDPHWKKLVDSGWRIAPSTASIPGIYLFERCQ